MDCRRIAILGSTGSIGVSTLAVAAHHPNRLKVTALSTHQRVGQLAEQARQWRPQYVVIADENKRSEAAAESWPAETQVWFGTEALERVAADPSIDVVVGAIVGIAGLPASLAAISAGKTLALANKETLVAAGPVVTEIAAKTRAPVLPVDSEHSAIFQCLMSGRREDVRRIILTASGGPFRKFTKEQLATVTVEQALDHPTWKMGRKITVDSATMMNKGLEIIEARWLFDLGPDQIDVVVHPQSVVHSLVEFVDGAMIAQLSPPDMRLPIQLALSYPQRWECPAPGLDFSPRPTLEFEPPDFDRFPAIPLCMEVARTGGTAGVVVNAANEAAVAAFLERRLPYHQIVPACQAVVRAHPFDAKPTLSDILRLDGWARQEIEKWIRA
jgi:1-deoxy-D-xylulose-5-phosphate reductoisomerase